MTPILWIGFQTPSVKELNKNKKFFLENNIEMENLDVMKLIKDRNDTLLWVYHKKNKKIAFTKHVSELQKTSILELINNIWQK